MVASGEGSSHPSKSRVGSPGPTWHARESARYLPRIDGRVHLGTDSSPIELIGRTTERRALDELLGAVRDGRSRVLVLEGDAGVGKSALLQYLIGAALDFQVVLANGVESEMELPFAALHQVCAPLLDGLDALPEPQRDAAGAAFGLTTGTSSERLLIGLAALNLLSAASVDGPVLCVVDDAQWLDHASVQALTFVARRLLADRVGMVFATRGPNSELAEFPVLAVARLQDADAQALLSSVLHVPLDERVRDRVVAETGGNPLALVEWPRGLTSAELAGGFALPPLPMTGQIEESFRRRVADLPTVTQTFLTVAAAEPTGDAVLVWRAASSLGVEPGDAAPAIDAGLVEIGVRVWFRHPLVRSATYGSASLVDRQAAHRALAEVTDPEREPDRRAWHRALGSPGPDDEVAEALERSADHARARGGLAAAAALLERSAALTTDPVRRGPRILAAAADHLEAGSFDAAARLLASAEAAPLDEMGRAQVDLLRGRHAIFGGDVRDGPRLLLRAARRLDPLDADLARFTYLHATGAATVVGSLGRDSGLRDVALAVSARLEPPVRTNKDWLLDGLAQVTLDGPVAAASALRQGLEASPAVDNSMESIYWIGHQSGGATLLWDIDTFHRLSVEYVEMCRELGALPMLPVALNSLAHAFLLEGDLNGAERALVEAQELLVATGSSLVFTSVVALLAGWRGDESAATVIDQQIEAARAAGLGGVIPSALWARATLANGHGRYEQALAAASDAMQYELQRAEQFAYHELVEAAVRCGQASTAANTVERLGEFVEATGADWAIGIHCRSRALLAGGALAEELYRDAIDYLSRTPIRPELARAHLLFGEWLRREGRRVDAREELRTAHEMFADMGIRGFAERTRHELQATGATLRKRGADSFDTLTPQEAHIAHLAAERRTNPEIGEQLFISPRTVEYHLSKVFAKLGVSSRRELRDALASAAAR